MPAKAKQRRRTPIGPRSRRVASAGDGRPSENELRLRAILETAVDGIITIDERGVIESLNPAAEGMFHYAAAELIGQNVKTLMPEPYRSEHDDYLRNYLTTGRKKIIGIGREVVGCRKDGSTFPMDLDVSEVRLGERRLFTGIVRDISARKRNEAALRENEERLRLSQQIAHIGTFDWDITSGVNVWTPELEALYGLPPGGFAQTQAAWEGLVHPDDRANTFQKVELGFQTGQPVTGDWRVVWPGGTVRWLSGRWQLFKDSSGRPVRMTGVNIDITDRKRAEEQLRRAEEQLLSLNENLERQVSERVELLDLVRDVTVIANEARTVAEGMEAALKRICEHCHWHLGHVYMLANDDDRVFVNSGVWYPAAGSERFRQISAQTQFASGEGFIGRVVETVRPLWVDDLHAFADWRRRDAAALGLRAAIAFPIYMEQKVLAVMEFFGTPPIAPAAPFLEIMNTIGIQLGHLVARKRAEKMIADATLAQQQGFGRMLHDTVSQQLTGVASITATLIAELKEDASSRWKRAARIGHLIQETQHQVQLVARGLLPVEIDTHGLASALERLADQCREVHGIASSFQCKGDIALEDSLKATHLYYIAQEAVQNAIKHAPPNGSSFACSRLGVTSLFKWRIMAREWISTGTTRPVWDCASCATEPTSSAPS